MRIDYRKYPEISRSLRALSDFIELGILEPTLVELVKVRASQLNRCAHCLEMHIKEAVSLGESHDRLHLVATWKEAPIFTDRERAAFMWCEEITLLSESEASDECYDALFRVFTVDEACRLTLAIVAINSWNRIAVAFRAPVGGYVARASRTRD